MRALRSEKGKSTESTIISFQTAALRWKPAPGNQAGRCFTDGKVFVSVSTEHKQGQERTKREDVDCPETTASGDMVSVKIRRAFDLEQRGVIVARCLQPVDDIQVEATSITANCRYKVTTA